MLWWCHNWGWKGISIYPVKPEFPIHSDYHVSNINVNTVVFFLSQTCLSSHFFSDSKKCSPVAKAPLPSARIDWYYHLPACTRALTQITIKFPWPRLPVGCTCYPCGFAIVVVNVYRADINRYALSGNAVPETRRSFLWTQWHSIGNTSMTNSKIVSIGSYWRAHGRSKNNQLVHAGLFSETYTSSFVKKHSTAAVISPNELSWQQFTLAHAKPSFCQGE